MMILLRGRRFRNQETLCKPPRAINEVGRWNLQADPLKTWTSKGKVEGARGEETNKLSKTKN